MRKKARLKNKKVLTLKKVTKKSLAKQLGIPTSHLRWSDGLLQRQNGNHWAPIPGQQAIFKNG